MVPDRSAETMHPLSKGNKLGTFDFSRSFILPTCMNAKTMRVTLPSRGYLGPPHEGTRNPQSNRQGSQLGSVQQTQDSYPWSTR